MSGPAATPSVVRRDRRAAVHSLTAHMRASADAGWRESKLQDLSIGGALVQSGIPVVVGQHLFLRLSRRDGVDVDVKAQVLRVMNQGDHPLVALRFIELNQAITTTLATILSEALDAVDDDVSASDETASTATPPLTALRLHDVSLYDLLDMDPSTPDGELEGRFEELIASVAEQLAAAVGRREARLKVLHASLERMRPLWTDPVKRARYDLRWGYLRIEQRLRDAESGAGLSLYMLAGIWFDLYADQVREANQLVHDARTKGELTRALHKALELDPFCPEKRERLATLEQGRAARRAASEAREVRGSLHDIALKSLLRSSADNGADVEVVVRVSGRAVGVVGVTAGTIVTARCGEVRGLDAVRMLCSLPDGTFQARYAAPREHLRHMETPAALILDEIEADKDGDLTVH